MIINLKRNYFGLILIAAGLAISGYVVLRGSSVYTENHQFSGYGMLSGTWERYKNKFVSSEGMIINESNGETATSEGQSYGMLRAVIIDDKETFDSVWNWTKKNMKRPNDNLFGWKYGKTGINEYGFTKEDINSATDADSDIALALILAKRRWGEEKYETEAKNILNDLWELTVVTVKGKPYLTAGVWASSDEELIINPSYWSPYAWRIFSEVDTKNDWMSLVDPAYEALNKMSFDNLDKNTSAGLPPDWAAMDKMSGKIKAPENKELTTNYSYDAMRIPFRIGLDYRWFGEKQASDYLSSGMKYLKKEYEQKGKLAAGYSHDGKVLSNFENPSMYATALSYFSLEDQKMAKDIFEKKIVRLYSNDTSGFREDIPYYEQNWMWLASASYFNMINNFKGVANED